ncbi:hypothetical protein [Aquimarina sp. AD1]|uniref:hypothetical protein n=2 Tax=Aquimarina sp. (strain AD1) TaxID=1714848 RepID=UPI0011C39DC3|nr:hypothetical protein [Aquimarina sp. AD1]
MKNFLILLMFFTFNKMVSQETIEMKETYIDNNLVYQSINDKLFTGIAQKKRKNGHLVYEEEYENGIILSSNLYYNGKEKRVSNKTIYNPNKPLVLLQEHKYDLKGEIFETVTYNNDGIKILLEQFEKEKLTYSCQYLGKKKNGIEYCLNKNGVETQIEYRNGKKVK